MRELFQQIGLVQGEDSSYARPVCAELPKGGSGLSPICLQLESRISPKFLCQALMVRNRSLTSFGYVQDLGTPYVLDIQCS